MQYELFAPVQPIINSMKKDNSILWWMYKNIDFKKVYGPILNVIAQQRSNRGRPPVDLMMLLKILLLCAMGNISFPEIEELLKYRLDYRAFVGLPLSHLNAPDMTTIWKFRQNLLNHDLFADIWQAHISSLKEHHKLRPEGGQIIDSSIFDTRRQHNTKEENELIKEGKIPQAWKDNSYKLRQKDLDASYGCKGMRRIARFDEIYWYPELHVGYKLHANVDVAHKIIWEMCVTPANVHDGYVLPLLVFRDDTCKEVFADKIYLSEKNIAFLRKLNLVSRIIKKKPKDRELTAEEMQFNREASVPRVRVEHVFGDMKGRSFKPIIRTIGWLRAEANLIMQSITTNYRRMLSLSKPKKSHKRARKRKRQTEIKSLELFGHCCA